MWKTVLSSVGAKEVVAAVLEEDLKYRSGVGGYGSL